MKRILSIIAAALAVCTFLVAMLGCSSASFTAQEKELIRRNARIKIKVRFNIEFSSFFVLFINSPFNAENPFFMKKNRKFTDCLSDYTIDFRLCILNDKSLPLKNRTAFGCLGFKKGLPCKPVLRRNYRFQVTKFSTINLYH